MMDKKSYKSLMQKIDGEILCLQVSHPVPSPTELPHSVGLIINKHTNISQIPEAKIPLVHSMLHMFHSKKGGKGLSIKTIEKLHSEISKRLKKHEKFDSLDEK